MKRILILVVLSLSACTNKTYTLSTLDKQYHTDVDAKGDWYCISGKEGLENLNDRPRKIGDTVEIVHIDNTTTKYILTAIK